VVQVVLAHFAAGDDVVLAAVTSASGMPRATMPAPTK
jgi:hypothetical protein